jgi:hypothetical protein
MTTKAWIRHQIGRGVHTARALGTSATTRVRSAVRHEQTHDELGDPSTSAEADHDEIRRQLDEVRRRLDAHVATSEASTRHLAVDIAALFDAARRGTGRSTANEVLAEALWLTNAPLAEHPLITVIVPTADETRSGYLRSAIDSVVAQTYRNWELIVVDDSVDGVLKHLPDWWPDDARITVITSASSDSGVARNRGLAAANGAVVAYLDDDCRFFVWWLHALAYAFSADRALAVVHGVLESLPGRRRGRGNRFRGHLRRTVGGGRDRRAPGGRSIRCRRGAGGEDESAEEADGGKRSLHGGETTAISTAKGARRQLFR